MLDTAFANRQDRDITSLTRFAVPIMRKALRLERQKALRQYLTGNAPQVDLTGLQEQLSALMLAGHLMGIRRILLFVKQYPTLRKKAVALSQLSDALDVLKSRLGIDTSLIQEKYQTDAYTFLKGASDTTNRELLGTFQKLVQDGAHINEAKAVLGDKLQSLGVGDLPNGRIETLYRTNLQLTYSAGRFQAEQTGAIGDALWGYKYVTVADGRVRPEHAALDGITLPKNDPFWNRFYPPNGWNCRCYTIPIFEQREVVRPPDSDENGKPLQPDKGFDFNPGQVLPNALTGKTNRGNRTIRKEGTQPKTRRTAKKLPPVITPKVTAEKPSVPLPQLPIPTELNLVPKPPETPEKHLAYAIKNAKPLVSDMRKLAEKYKPKEFDYSEFEKVQKELADINKSFNPNISTVEQMGLIEQANKLLLQEKELIEKRKAFLEQDSFRKEKSRKEAFKKLAAASPTKAALRSGTAEDMKALPGNLSRLADKPKRGSAIPKNARAVMDTMRSIVDEKAKLPDFFIAQNTTGRAHAVAFQFLEMKQLHIALSESDSPRVYAHEIGHLFEYNKGNAKVITEFVKRRTADTPRVSLKELYPGSDFDATEYGNKDDFEKATKAVYGDKIGERFAYYAGKQYPELNATEITSMGFEMLYSDPVAFANADPEYFSVMVGLLRGQYAD